MGGAGTTASDSFKWVPARGSPSFLFLGKQSSAYLQAPIQKHGKILQPQALLFVNQAQPPQHQPPEFQGSYTQEWETPGEKMSKFFHQALRHTMPGSRTLAVPTCQVRFARFYQCTSPAFFSFLCRISIGSSGGMLANMSDKMP